MCGSLIKWLRDSLGLIATTAETGPLASSVPSTGDVIIVPAFSGLFAPHWRPDARGIIIGITAFTNKAHIVRAALEACAYQTLELVEAMEMDIAAHFSVSSSSSPPSSSPWKLTSLRVDGGMVVNEFMTQFQADVLQREVRVVWSKHDKLALRGKTSGDSAGCVGNDSAWGRVCCWARCWLLVQVCSMFR